MLNRPLGHLAEPHSGSHQRPSSLANGMVFCHFDGDTVCVYNNNNNNNSSNNNSSNNNSNYQLEAIPIGARHTKFSATK